MPTGDLPLGGIFARRAGRSRRRRTRASARTRSRSRPTAASGSRSRSAISSRASIPRRERFEIHEVAEGYYPHTLRFDAQGRIWYTIAASNHVGMFDPATGAQRHVRLPARTWQQELALRLMPALLWLDQQVDLAAARAAAAASPCPCPTASTSRPTAPSGSASSTSTASAASIRRRSRSSCSRRPSPLRAGCASTRRARSGCRASRPACSRASIRARALPRVPAPDPPAARRRALRARTCIR